MKSYSKILMFFLLCSVLLLSTFLFGCSGENKISPTPTAAPKATEIAEMESKLFEDSTHVRNDEYSRTFKIKYREFEGLNIGFSDDLYDEKELVSLFENIYDDYNKIVEFLNSNEVHNDSDIDIYVLDATIAGGSYIAGGNVYCTAEDLADGEYRIPLIQAYAGIKQPWIPYGLADVIFNKADEFDNTALAEYYINNDDISVLSLYGTLFYKDWNTDDEIDVAKQTSASLAHYLLDNYGYDSLFNVTDSLKSEWLKSIGVEKKYIDEYSGMLHDLTYSKAEHYSMVVEGEVEKYYLSIFDDLANAKEVEEFIYRDITSRDFVLNYLKNNVSKYSHVIDYDAVYSYCIKQGMLSRNTSENIYLVRKSSHLHEAAHSMVPGQGEGHWQYEGIAHYLSLCVYKNNYDSERFSGLIPDMIANFESGEANIDDYDYMVFKYYFQNDGGWESAEKFDFRLYSDCASYITMYIDKDFGSAWIHLPIYDHSSISKYARKPGDELSNAQALSFSAYLIEKYSFDAFIGFCEHNSDFEEVFGADYETLKAEWIEYLAIIGES